MKRAMNKIHDDMRIDSSLFDPDSLWRRPNAGYVPITDNVEVYIVQMSRPVTLCVDFERISPLSVCVAFLALYEFLAYNFRYFGRLLVYF